MIVWIEKALALALHDRQLAEHGGSTGVRDDTLLQSALARPQQLFAYGDPVQDTDTAPVRRTVGAGGVRSTAITAFNNGVLAPAPAPTFQGTVSRAHLADLAASLAFGLAKNHPFVDGNKRTAYVCCETFLALNDAELEASVEDKYVTILALAEGKLKEREFAAWLRAHIHMCTRRQVQEVRAKYKVSPKARSKKTNA